MRTEKLDNVARILNHTPIPLALIVTIRLKFLTIQFFVFKNSKSIKNYRDSHKIFRACIRMANKLKIKANNGPSGNAAANKLTNPN